MDRADREYEEKVKRFEEQLKKHPPPAGKFLLQARSVAIPYSWIPWVFIRWIGRTKKLLWLSNFGHIDRLFSCRFEFIRIGRRITQCRVWTDAVVEADDVVGDVSDGFSMVGVVLLPDTLHF